MQGGAAVDRYGFLHACTCLLYCVINFCDVNVFTHVFCVTSSFFGRVVGVFIGLYFYRIDHSCFGGHEGLFSQVSVYIMAFVVNSNFFHIFLTSDGCLNRFHKNRPNDFWIGLQNEKVLGNSRRWSVGIQNIHFDSDLYNMGSGSGVSFMFMYEGEYHVVHPKSQFVSSPLEAVAALNAALSSYCSEHRSSFGNSKKTAGGVKKPVFSGRSDLNSGLHSVLSPDFSMEWVSNQPPPHDIESDEESESYNDILVALEREQKEKDENSFSGKEFKRGGSVDSTVRLKLSSQGGDRGKRAVSEQPNLNLSKSKFKSTDETVGKFNPELLLKFFIDEKSGKIVVRVGVDDFAMSQMMRFMLGFHSRKKIFEESFEFRKKCRLFFKPFSTRVDLVAAIEKQAHMLFPIQIRKSLPEDRDRLYTIEFGGWGYDRFWDSYGTLLDSVLKSLISGHEAEYETFVEKAYYPSRRGPLRTVKGRELPFYIYSMIDFIYYVIALTGVDGFKSESKVLLKSDSVFRAHIFDRLFVYSNIVKPVDYDDKQLRLLDVIYLQPKNGGNYGVVDYRSVVFQEVDVDILKEIHIIVTTSLGTPAPFMHGPMCLTLLFRKET